MRLRLLLLLIVGPALVYGALFVGAWYSLLTHNIPLFVADMLCLALAVNWRSIVSARHRAAKVDDNFTINLSITPNSTGRVTPECITETLRDENVIRIIKHDLLCSRQIGYKEEWRLGLIAPDQGRSGPPAQLRLKRTAVLHSTDYFAPNNVAISGGLVKPLGQPQWAYELATNLNQGEFIDIRSIQVEPDREITGHQSAPLLQFLREDGFPLRDAYVDGDPLTTDRGGTIVIDQGKMMVIYPRYFVQRRLIDDEGNLVHLGLDENLDHNPKFQVKLEPSVSRELYLRVLRRNYSAVVRYRSFPYASDLMLPLVDTPMSASGWADLFVDTRGKAKLFIAKDKTEAEWYKLMATLKQLFDQELAKKDYHLLGLTKDKAHLNAYLSQKMAILQDYFVVRDWDRF